MPRYMNKRHKPHQMTNRAFHPAAIISLQCRANKKSQYTSRDSFYAHKHFYAVFNSNIFHTLCQVQISKKIAIFWHFLRFYESEKNNFESRYFPIRNKIIVIVL